MGKFWYTDWFTWNQKKPQQINISQLPFFQGPGWVFLLTVATPMTLDVISSLTVNIFLNKVLTASLTDLDLSAANYKASYH